MIALDTARALLDLGRRIGDGPRAEEQLRGAVALHNLLSREGVAYLADEVGMGKTFVALGALALFRHFNPRFRALVIAPRENIQRKWAKELANFVQHNVRHTDLRVRAFGGQPAREVRCCENLVELVRETSLDPNRDFILRMSSFSLASGRDEGHLGALRNKLRHELPWLSDDALDLRAKAVFKRHFARAVCCALPAFDLVIVDEAHNLKHGYSTTGSARNEVIAEVFGRPNPTDRPDHRHFPGHGARARRVLFLSATPVDEGWQQLWNQLDLFGFATPKFDALRRSGDDDAGAREAARRFLVRRVTTIPIEGRDHTRNQYRREWRAGGVATYDEPIHLRDDRQRLVVALVQKKVSELLGEHRFKRSFQIGMLASFESFSQTAKVRGDEEASNFDDSEQTEDALEREGVDVQSLNALARSYRGTFGAEMPHPKMDAVVERLASAWTTGEKSLVFVRRVASVRELKRKLDERYNAWLIDSLRAELPEALRADFDELARRFQDERRRHLDRGVIESPDDVSAERAVEDHGGRDTFFAWFFRSELPDHLNAHRVAQRFRVGLYETFFADNHAMALLDADAGTVVDALSDAVGEDRSMLRPLLAQRAAQYLPRTKDGPSVAQRFDAVQAAALELLGESAHDPALRARARVRWTALFHESRQSTTASDRVGDVVEALERRTFFSELRHPDRALLRARIWPAVTPRDATAEAAYDAIREESVRAALLAAVARLGHAFIDLYLLALRDARSLRARPEGREGLRPYDALIDDYLDRLDAQRAASGSRFDAFHELSEVAAHHALILDVNLASLRDRPLAEVNREIGSLLRQQQPVGGMSGQVNQTLVRQFRMPGYPVVLVTTDLLQEGEDLHTFCASVHHYGLSWTPSSMEQRVGRVDRVRSKTERRLGALDRALDDDDKLQVYIPHLQDTVEVLQVERVLERMNRFLRMMHESLTPPRDDDRRVDLRTEMVRARPKIESIRETLRSAFPVREDMLGREVAPLAVPAEFEARLRARLEAFRRVRRAGALALEWESTNPRGALLGTARLPNGRLQPFTVLLRGDRGRPVLRCVSPVGRTDAAHAHGRLAPHAARLHARIGVVLDDDARTYDLTVEDDVALTDDPAHDTARLALLLERVIERADKLEQLSFDDGRDHPLNDFKRDLERE